ncbi:glycine-rich RNA-binding protein 2, mitochondrial-like [Lotus japonicus]|uniref:glycine-rich RNA-binding protein 2, mitochondrial-like n=1 Tax=Lotus japonicus TaxID=34305 RepID=UPI00258FED2F|nr:glycine-rich RNA-binding protein 2, mitochondrial-like [Lotus japonicus]
MRLTSPIANCVALLHRNSLPPRFLFARHHSHANLFVAGLSHDTNETVLRDAFGQHGEILEVRVICDHVTGKSKGYGFVRFTSETTAATARHQMHGQVLDGSRIRVSCARKVWPPNLSSNSQDVTTC